MQAVNVQFPSPEVVGRLLTLDRHMLVERLDQYREHAPHFFRQEWLAPILSAAIARDDMPLVVFFWDVGGSDIFYKGTWFAPLAGHTISSAMKDFIGPKLSTGARKDAWMAAPTASARHLLLDTWPPELKSPLDVAILLKDMDRSLPERASLLVRLKAHLAAQTGFV